MFHNDNMTSKITIFVVKNIIKREVNESLGSNHIYTWLIFKTSKS